MSAAARRRATPTLRPEARREELVVSDSFDELIIYDRGRHRMHCLGPLVASVWRACNGRRTLAQIGETVKDAEGRPLGEDALRLALARLRRARLVDLARLPPLAPSRRQALRRVAAFGGLALVSVASPSALQAASCTPRAVCAANTGKCSGLPCCENPNQRCLEKCAPGKPCGCC